MAEAHPVNENDTLLAGLNSGDLTSGSYEGGFKTWECAIDLAELVSTLDLGTGKWHVIELGSGSAIPSLVLLSAVLRGDVGGNASAGIRFTLCDYNEDVLTLCTMPNMLLTCLFTLPNTLTDTEDGEDQDVDLETLSSYITTSLEQQLQARGLQIEFLSGSWGDDFVELLQPGPTSSRNEEENLLILASETIYSPSSLPVFTQTIMSLLGSSKASRSARALVAAKKIYFGVGGGIDEFVREVRELGGEVRTVRQGGEKESTGVGRIVVEVTVAGGE